MKKTLAFLLCFLIMVWITHSQIIKDKKFLFISSPKAGERYSTVTELPIAWKSAGLAGQVDIILFKEYRSDKIPLKKNHDIDNPSYSHPLRDIPAGNYFVVLRHVKTKDAWRTGIFTIYESHLSKPDTSHIKKGYFKYTIPATILNRYSYRKQLQSATPKFWTLPSSPEHKQKSGRAWVGFENHYREEKIGDGVLGKRYAYAGFIFRSRLYFEIQKIIDRFKGKKYLLLEAKVNLKKRPSAYSVPKGLQPCGHKLFVLTGSWEKPVKCIDTPGYLYHTLPRKDNVSLDIAPLVRQWLSEEVKNQGLLLTGINEKFEHNNNHCVSYYTVELYLRFQEYFK